MYIVHCQSLTFTTWFLLIKPVYITLQSWNGILYRTSLHSHWNSQGQNTEFRNNSPLKFMRHTIFNTLPVTNGIWERFRWKCSGGSCPGCLAPLGYFRPTAPCADTGMVLVDEIVLFFLRLGFTLSTDAGLAVSNWVSLCNRHLKTSIANADKTILLINQNCSAIMYREETKFWLKSHQQLWFVNKKYLYLWLASIHGCTRWRFSLWLVVWLSGQALAFINKVTLFQDLLVLW